MRRLSTAKSVLNVKTFYENGKCATQTERKFRTNFRRNEAACESTVRRSMTKFETTGSVLTVKLPGRKRSCRTEEQLVLVQDSVPVSPGKSIHRRSQQLDIPTTLLHRISHKDL